LTPAQSLAVGLSIKVILIAASPSHAIGGI
jgi:hypothetical protein